MGKYVKFNQNRWNNVSRKKGNPYTVPLTSEEYKEAIENELSVGLTVGKTVPTEWFEKAKGKKFGYGKLMEIHQESEDRISFEKNQKLIQEIMPIVHIAYPRQLEIKQKQVADKFTRIGKFEDILVKETLGMKEPLNYRNKAQVPVGYEDGKLVTGVFRRRSHDIIPTDNLYINNKEIDRLVSEIREILNKYEIVAYNEDKHKGNIRHIVVKRGHYSKEVMVVLVTNEKTLASEKEIVEEIIALDSNIVSIIQNIQDKDTNVILGNKSKVLFGKDYYTDKMLGLDFKISAKSFYQVNTPQAEKIYEEGINIAELTGAETVLDAYCGIGTITLNLAKKAKKVYGIEIVDEAIRMARENADLNKIDNTEFIVGKSEEILPKLKKDGINFELVFVDPPRKGLDKTFIDTLIEMDIPKIVYISCNPSTQARDCQLLAEAGYKPKYIRPVDMFPMTMHVEVVTLLVKE